MRNEYRLSIITINYNGLKDTCELIDSIPFNDNLEVIVVDNASKEGEASIISKKYPQVKVIRSDKNLGFAGGNNLGIKEAKGDYIFLINNDTYFKDFNIDNLIERLESSEKIGIVCPKLRFAWGINPIQFAGYTPLTSITLRNNAIGFGKEDHGQYNTAHPTPYAHGAAMLIKRDAIDKVGLMPECFFLYYEEIDWSMMFTRAGYETWYDPACTVYHKESQTTGQNSPLRTYYITRNRLLLVKRNYTGINKYLSYIYLFGVVGIKDLLKYSLKRQASLRKAVYMGLWDFTTSKFARLTSKLD